MTFCVFYKFRQIKYPNYADYTMPLVDFVMLILLFGSEFPQNRLRLQKGVLIFRE